jgi:methionine--tRNA ligase beta chain
MLVEDKPEFEQLGNWKSMTGRQLPESRILFEKLQKKAVDHYRNRFSGGQVKSTIPADAWSKIQLKVGEIKAVSLHPSADLLYVEKIDCGEAQPRTIVSGLVKHYTAEELLGRRVLIVTNLAPADLRGVRSEGMLLTAEKKKHLEVIETDDAQPGTEVLLAGESVATSDPEITIDQFLAAGLKIENFLMKAGDQPLTLNQKPIQTKRVANGKVK